MEKPRRTHNRGGRSPGMESHEVPVVSNANRCFLPSVALSTDQSVFDIVGTVGFLDLKEAIKQHYVVCTRISRSLWAMTEFVRLYSLSQG